MPSRRQFLSSAAAFLAAMGSARAQERLAVVASFSILGDFVRAVAGGRADVTVLVGPDGDAHVYSPTPADAKAVAQARLLVVNGLNFEGWMERLIRSSGSKASVVVASAGIVPLALAAADHNAHDKTHKTGGAPAPDPHAWQDVRHARRYVANIREALIKVDPAGAEVYEANARAYLGKLDELEREIRGILAKIPEEQRRIVTSHDAFGYFGKAFGFAFIAPQGVSTEAEASARDAAKIIRQVKAQKIPAIFLENITNPRLAEQIARETGAKIGGRLYSDALSGPDGPASTYILMMQHNIREIGKVLQAGPA